MKKVFNLIFSVSRYLCTCTLKLKCIYFKTNVYLYNDDVKKKINICIYGNITICIYVTNKLVCVTFYMEIIIMLMIFARFLHQLYNKVSNFYLIFD